MKDKTVISLLWGYRPGGVTECVKAYSRIPDDSNFIFKTLIIQKESWGNDFSAFEKDVNLEVIYFNHYLSLNWFRKLIREVAKSPTLLFAHSFNGAIIAFLIQLFSRKKVSIICTYHGLYIAPTKEKKLLAKFYNRISFFIYNRIAKGVMCVSYFSKEELVANGVDPKKIQVVHNSIPDLSNSLESKVTLPISIDGHLVVGVICRLVPLKGLEIIIEAVKQIPDIKLLIVGDGPLKKKLSEECQSLNERIVFAGHQKDVLSWLNRMDIFVLPSYVENHSIAILEAMRQKKAIITTTVGGNAESVRNNMEGLLVSPGSVLELKEAILKLKDNPTLRRNLSTNARKRFLEKFTEDKMHKQMATYLNSHNL